MTPHDALLKALASYSEVHPEEAEVSARIATLVRGHPDCFERTCRPGHLTGSAWVVSADGERHLLLHHKKLGKWLQPGGHADGETDLASVALREAEEESGLFDLRLVADPNGFTTLDLDVHAIPARYSADGSLREDAHEHHDLRFLLRATGDESLTLSDESHELRWCRAAEVLTLTTERSVLRLLEKAQRRLIEVGIASP